LANRGVNKVVIKVITLEDLQNNPQVRFLAGGIAYTDDGFYLPGFFGYEFHPLPKKKPKIGNSFLTAILPMLLLLKKFINKALQKLLPPKAKYYHLIEIKLRRLTAFVDRNNKQFFTFLFT